ncbi:DNA replication terminus site-binding protein [Klebsiella pneumoniae]
MNVWIITFRQIELELQALQQALSELAVCWRAGYIELPAMGKDAEHDPLATMSGGAARIGKTALARALRHYSHLFIQQQSENRSSKAAEYACRGLSACRLPPRSSRICWRVFRHLDALKATFGEKNRHRRLRPAPHRPF